MKNVMNYKYVNHPKPEIPRQKQPEEYRAPDYWNLPGTTIGGLIFNQYDTRPKSFVDFEKNHNKAGALAPG